MSKPNPKIGSSNFNELSALRDDQALFEARRKELIEEFLDAVPEEKRLRMERFQFRIDGFRRKYKHPLVCMEKLGDWMFASHVEGVQNLVEAGKQLVVIERCAKVIEEDNKRLKRMIDDIK